MNTGTILAIMLGDRIRAYRYNMCNPMKAEKLRISGERKVIYTCTCIYKAFY